MATTLVGSIADVNLRTSVLAKKNENSKLATQPDDIAFLTMVFNEAITEVETRIGIVYGKTTTTDADGVVTTTTAYLADNPTLLPKELNKSITYKMMSEWFKGIGEMDLMNLYNMNFEEEIKKYRFPPSRDIIASRGTLKYRPLG